MKKGFTLPEILVAVLIVAVLAAMAVPQYEKAVEKSRKAEIVATLKKLYDSKMRMVDAAELTKYEDGVFGFQHLDVSFPCTNTFVDTAYVKKCETNGITYCLLPKGATTDKEKNAVCARRTGGDYPNTDFIYYGEGVQKDGENPFVCKQSGTDANCEIYGMSNLSTAPECACK